MKRITSLFLFVILFLLTLSSCNNAPELQISQDTVRYAASCDSDKYHLIDCYYVDRIKSSNIVYYYTRDEAQRDSKIPCSVCKP